MGADPNSDDCSSIYRAIDKNSSQILDLLLQYGGNWHIGLKYAKRLEKYDMCKVLSKYKTSN